MNRRRRRRRRNRNDGVPKNGRMMRKTKRPRPALEETKKWETGWMETTAAATATVMSIWAERME